MCGGFFSWLSSKLGSVGSFALPSFITHRLVALLTFLDFNRYPLGKISRQYLGEFILPETLNTLFVSKDSRYSVFDVCQFNCALHMCVCCECI